jgi:hypothetical protein
MFDYLFTIRQGSEHSKTAGKCPDIPLYKAAALQAQPADRPTTPQAYLLASIERGGGI